MFHRVASFLWLHGAIEILKVSFSLKPRHTNKQTGHLVNQEPVKLSVIHLSSRGAVA